MIWKNVVFYFFYFFKYKFSLKTDPKLLNGTVDLVNIITVHIYAKSWMFCYCSGHCRSRAWRTVASPLSETDHLEPAPVWLSLLYRYTNSYLKMYYFSEKKFPPASRVQKLQPEPSQSNCFHTFECSCFLFGSLAETLTYCCGWFVS